MESRYADLLKEWKMGQFRPVYYFIGEDSAAKAGAASELRKAFNPDNFNFTEFSGDTESQAASIISEAMTLPVFANKRLVLVNQHNLGAKVRAALIKYLKEPCPSTTLVLFSEERKPAAKDALCTAVLSCGAIGVFAPMGEEEAAEKLQAKAKQAGKTLRAQAAQTLIMEAGTDWNILSQELEKALLYAGKADEISSQDIISCLGYHKSADPFALPRMIQTRQAKTALAHWRQMLQDGKAEDQSFKALSQISGAVQKQLRAKRMLQAGSGQDSIFSALRLHRYWDKDFIPRISRLSEPRLLRDLKLCLKTEVALKSKTWLSAPQELEKLIIGICSEPSTGKKTPREA